MCFTRKFSAKVLGRLFQKLKINLRQQNMKGGSPKIEKNFFAYLDELDHLEAKKRINKIDGK